MFSFLTSPFILTDLPPALLLSAPITAALFTIFLSIMVWKRRNLRGGTLFFWLMLWIAILTTSEALELLSPSLLWRLRFLTLQQAARGLVAAYWLIFVWGYVRGENSMPRALLAFIWTMTLLNLVLVFTNPWHHFVWRFVEWPTETPFFPIEVWGSIWLDIQGTLVLLAGLTVILMLLRHLYSASGVLRKQTGVILIGSLGLESGFLLEIGHLKPLGPVDPFPITIIFSSLMFAWGLMQRHLLTFTPIAREQVLDAIPALVLVVDEQGHLLDINAPAERLFGMQAAEVLGKHYERVFAAWPQEIAQVREAETFPLDLQITLQGEERHFQVVVTPLQDGGQIILLTDVTQERRIQQAFYRVHSRLRTLLDNSPDLMVIKDGQGHWELANPAMLALFNLEGKPWEGKSDAELARMVPFYADALEHCRTSDQNAWEQGNLYHSEEPIPSPDGEIHIFDVLKVPLFHADGSRRELIIQARDITSQKHAEQRLRHYGVRQQLLLEVSAHLNSLQHVQEVYAYLTQVGAELLAADGSRLYTLDSSRNALRCIAAHNTSQEEPPIAPGEGVVGQVFATRKPLFIEDYPHWPGRLPRYRENPPPYHAAIGIPISWGEEVLLVLLVFKNAPEGQFSVDDLNLLTLLAHLSSGVLINARLREQESEQRKLADTLRESALMLNSSLEPEEIYSLLLQEARKLVPYDSANLMLIDSEGNARIACAVEYERFISPEMVEALRAHTFALDDLSGLRTIFQNRAPIRVHDTAAAEGWVVTPWGAHIRSWVGVPILIDGRVRAIFSLDSARAGFYQEKHVRLLQTFSSQAALALQNALLFDKIRRMALIDALTQLPNRRYLFSLGEREVERTRRFRQPLSAIMLDIDHFKRINDTYGHSIGDEVLACIAERLQRVLRNVDVIGRYGGEEFSILLPNVALQRSMEVAERLRRSISERSIPTSGGGIAVTISLGVAEWRSDMDDLTELLDVADQGLYMAKQAGRNRVRSIQNTNAALT